VEQPFEQDFERDLDWICETLGFAPSIDSDKAPSHIFKTIVKSTEEGKGISSTQLSQEVRLSRGAVIHHLNNLQRAGLVVKDGRLYFARSRSMLRTVQEIEEDIKRIFDKMEKVATAIDKEMGME
jgi:predicted transcriptional regulator